MLGFPSPSISQPSFDRRRPYPMYGERGMVAAAHPLTVEAGMVILRAGGNAVDAAVGAGLVAAVVMPEMCGLGGDLFAVVSANGEVTSIQGSGIAPRGASYDLMASRSPDGRQMEHQGPLSISVPGMVGAYFEMLSRWGTKSFAEVMQPALELARNGFVVHPLGAEILAGAAELLAQDEAASAIFLPGGKPIAAGERLIQADLAKTLETLGQDGKASFYSGDLAERITTYLQSVGGALTVEDFSSHATDFTPPLSATYRGYQVYQTGLPSQGLILLESLNLVEQFQAIDPLSAEGIHLLVEAKKIAYADRLGYAGDPAFVPNRVDTLLSKRWATDRAKAIDPARAATDVAAGQLQDGDTTYLAVIDGDGMMVSQIQSVSSAFGSCVVGGDTGVVLNNRVGRGFTLEQGHPNIYEPGKKTMHTLNCYMIADGDGTPVLVGGTPGGDGQPQWNLQNIVGLIDQGWDVQTAIDAPRWTSWPGTDPIAIANPFQLRLESRFGESVISALRELGHDVVEQGTWGGGGSVQIIARDPQTGILIGGTDPRVEGNVQGF